MVLGEIIKVLAAEPPDKRLRLGFNHPHSYRGYYEQLAFEPAENITIGEMLLAARSALESTYEGWKGGEFTMDEYTDCWLAQVGDTGETIGPILLKLMLQNSVES